jgi:hypothetical protein
VILGSQAEVRTYSEYSQKIMDGKWVVKRCGPDIIVDIGKTEALSLQQSRAEHTSRGASMP